MYLYTYSIHYTVYTHCSHNAEGFLLSVLPTYLFYQKIFVLWESEVSMPIQVFLLQEKVSHVLLATLITVSMPLKMAGSLALVTEE